MPGRRCLKGPSGFDRVDRSTDGLLTGAALSHIDTHLRQETRPRPPARRTTFAAHRGDVLTLASA